MNSESKKENGKLYYTIHGNRQQICIYFMVKKITFIEYSNQSSNVMHTQNLRLKLKTERKIIKRFVRRYYNEKYSLS